MTISYVWKIPQMDTKPQEGNLMDVVVTVHWIRNAVAIDGGKEYKATSYGTMACQTPSETDFTAYPDLTFDQVCGWLDAGLDVPAIDAYLLQNIENQINPPVIILPNPWDVPPAI